MTKPLFKEDPPAAARQSKTDRLILARFLRESAKDFRLDEKKIELAHKVILKWADLDSSGRLAKLHETQLQGEFLSEVFGGALDYNLVTDTAETWHLEREYMIAGQSPDAILGFFQQDTAREPQAIIELKGPKVHLDRDRSNGRTAVQQCWEYLNHTSMKCRLGIVSNFVSFRIYERSSTPRRYEHFTLQSLRDPVQFRQFYYLFHRQGLIEKVGARSRVINLLEKTNNRQREVGEKLYQHYSENRTNLIAHLNHKLNFPLDEAIKYVQQLLDRVIFIAFCEDRGLLPPNTIKSAYEALPAFTQITNPRWQNFKTLFRFIDSGNTERKIPAYNGGLFAVSPADNLELDDKWTSFFNTVGSYDFADEVNLDVLGHLFERSITELEKLRITGLFGDAEKAEKYATMPQSVKRKQLGIYYTPPELTSRIVQYSVDDLIDERFADVAVEFGVEQSEASLGVAPDDVKYWRRCLAILKDLKIVDPACGSGAFLFQAYNSLELRYHEVIGHLEQGGAAGATDLAEQVPQFILHDNLYGVDLSLEAVEITQLALWIRSASRGQTLATLSENIVHGNSLVHDTEVHPAGFDWRERFAEVFQREQAGFDCVIGNPPWERMKLQEREFFSMPAPEIATASNAAKRRRLVARLESDDPALYERYQDALDAANSLLVYCRNSDEYPLTGKGDINTYAVFAELASQLVAPDGRVGLLTPSGIASDNTTKDFFAAIAESNRLIRFYDFENRTKKFFPDVDGRFKFCILNFGGSSVKHKQADFVFFTHHVEELEDSKRHIALSGADIKLLNPNTRTCPIFRTRRDAKITKAIYRRVPILIDKNRKGPTGNPWGVKFKRMFDQTNDAELFREADTLKAERFKLKGNRWVKGQQTFLPLYEGKMIQAYDHRAADVVFRQGNWVRQGQTDKTTLVQHANPEHVVTPRFWVNAHEVEIPAWGSLGFKDITSPTNQRTVISANAPLAGYTNHFVLVRCIAEVIRQMCLLANLNSFVYDYSSRQKIGGVTLNFFIVEQIPTLPPDTYSKPCPWQRKTTLESWISERVLKLTCTAEDMLPLAEACDFTSGSFQKEYGGRLNKWDEAERAELMAQLDAAYFLLYGVNREDAEYILSTFKGIHDSRDLLSNGQSTANAILDTYDRLSSRSTRKKR